MSLLVISATPRLHPRGGERSLAALLAAAPAGAAVRVAPGCEWAIEPAPARWRSWAFAAWVLRARRVIRSALRREQPEAVHCNDLPSFVAAWAIFKAPRPSLHVRGWPPDRLLWRTAFRLARRVVCVSDDVAARVLSIAPRASTAVLTNPVADPGIRYAGSSSNDVVIVGKVTPPKGQLAFVRAAGASLAARGLRVVFAGDDTDASYCGAVREAAASVGLDVSFLGYIDAIHELLAASLALVSASEEEGLPRVILEACVMEVPVLAVSAPGVAQILGDLVAFSRLPSLDGAVVVARLGLLDDPSWRVAREQRGRVLRESWSPKAAWKKFVRILDVEHLAFEPAP